MLLNNDSNLIPTQKITAPIITKDDFIRMFIEYAKSCANINEAELKYGLETNTGIVELDNYVFEEMPQDEIIPTEYVLMTNDEVASTKSSFGTIIGVQFTSQGIPFLGYLASSDSAIECFRMVYYSEIGDFKIYTPHYGNCWNIDAGLSMFSDEGDPEDDDDYCDNWGTDSNTVQNAPLYQLIDEAAIMQEIESVFVAGANLQNPVVSTAPHSNSGKNSNSGNNSSTTNTNPNSQPAPKQKSTMDVLYEVFSKKMFQMIPPLQQTLMAQGATSYDKNQCFKNLKDKDVFQKDIYNYILQFNNMDSVANKMIECTKISLYIKRFQSYHEGLIL